MRKGVALTVDLGILTEKGMVWMEMDTGNDDPAIVLSKSTAPLLGVDPANPAPQPVHVELAPGIVLQGNAHVVDNLIMDGNIGVKFLKAWNITLDLKHGKAWLAPAGALKSFAVFAAARLISPDYFAPDPLW